jgi:hypothetical protein
MRPAIQLYRGTDILLSPLPSLTFGPELSYFLSSPISQTGQEYDDRTALALASWNQLFVTSHPGRSVALTALLSFCLLPTIAQALPETKRVNSVKSLTHILSLVEEEHEGKARFFTMKLQIYLEDNYISQGTAIVLKPQDLSEEVGKLVEVEANRQEAGGIILRRYKDGEFHE